MAPDEAETRVTLAIRGEGEAINGTLDDGHGGHRPFWGWLELLAALAALRDEAAGDAAPQFPSIP